MQPTLQQTFPEIYKKLFSENEVVLSGHFGFNWFPSGIGHTTNFISIKQKIKSKCYVGIRKVSQIGISFDEILMFDGTTFSPYPPEHIDLYYHEALAYLAETFDLEKLGYGFRISVISESARGEGVGFTGTLCSLLSFWIGMISGKYKEELLSDYANFEKSSSFREIKEISHVCTWKVKKGNTGSAFYTTMLESPHPHVYLTDTKQETEEDIKFVEEYYQTIPHLLHLEEDATFATLPVRWALVYSGTKANTLSVEKQKKLTTSQNTNYSEWFLVQDFEKIHSHLHELFTHKNYYEILEDGLDEMSAKLLYLFAHIYKQGPRKEHITALIHTLNTLNYLYNNVEEDADFYDEFLEACVATQTSPTKFWVSPVYTSKHGGNYLVVFEEESDLYALEKVIGTMKGSRPTLRIAQQYDFTTPPSAGIRVEQNLYQQKFSERSSDNYVLLDNSGTQKFINYTDITPTETKGLFLDAVRGKVYINGKQQTSKEIKSQTTTIEIFDHLLQSAEGSIRNNQLGPSTFSGQQNQMLGKIIYPLNKLMKAETGKEFPLESSGSLRDFHITLGKTDLPIVLIKKI